MITAGCFAVAAALGAVVRHLVRIGAPQMGPLPIGTLVVNLLGSFGLGLLAGWSPPGATVVGTAGLGALTTFSTFSEEVLELRTAGWRWMVAYAGVSVVGGVALAWSGLQLA